MLEKYLFIINIKKFISADLHDTFAELDKNVVIVEDREGVEKDICPDVILTGLSSDNRQLSKYLSLVFKKYNKMPSVLFENLFENYSQMIEAVMAALNAKIPDRIENKFQGLFYVLDNEFKFTEISVPVSQITGYEKSELKGVSLTELIFEEDKNELLELVSQEHSNYTVSDFRLKTKGRGYTWVRNSLFAMDEGNGSVTYYGVMADISTQKNLESRLKTAKEEAEEVNRFKNVFLANISHELRTPMIAILGYAEILADELEEEEYQEMAHAIASSSDRFVKTLNLLLDLAKIETNDVELVPEEIKIAGLTEYIIKPHIQKAREKGLDIYSSTISDDMTVKLDRNLYKQVLDNLIDNAIKYTHEGNVTITIDRQAEDGNMFSLIKVKDSGIGIAEENLEKIFEPFRQNSEGFNRNYEGTGLGLSITKRFVEMMEGKITVSSEPGLGAEFTVKLPCVEVIEEYKTGRINNLSSPEY